MAKVLCAHFGNLTPLTPAMADIFIKDNVLSRNQRVSVSALCYEQRYSGITPAGTKNIQCPTSLTQGLRLESY